ncbi:MULTISPECIES: hypothetical protein [Priestia]|nr:MULTISPECIES: hypothetical protein [Priestia]
MIGGQGENSCGKSGKQSLARKSTAVYQVIHTSLFIQFVRL